MSKLDDLLGKKKEVVPVLDLSKTIINSKDEYKRLSEKVPDYKMRPIKVSERISKHPIHFDGIKFLSSESPHVELLKQI